jgi:DNA repair exonuclease SbcCD ATPase subunit
MSSTKDKIRDWFFALPEETRNRIDEQIENIRNQEDVTERHQQTLTKMVKELARMLESLVDDPSQISVIIKAISNGRIADRTIEEALPEDKKRRHKPLERYQDRETAVRGFQRPVTVSSDGSESYTKPDGTEGEREYNPYEGEPEPMPSIREVNEAATEIALSVADEYAKKAKEQEIRLREALQIADDKDKRIYQLEMEAGELEMQIADLKKQPAPKDVDKAEELQIENDNLKQTLEELKEAVRANVKASGFTQASHLPKQVWIAAINALNFYRQLNKASRHAIEHNDPWRRIVFDIAEDGQLKAAKLEGDDGIIT